MILVDDPNSWEASFYSVYFEAYDCELDEIPSRMRSLRNLFPNLLSMVNSNMTNDLEKQDVLSEIVDRTILISDKLFSEVKTIFDIEYNQTSGKGEYCCWCFSSDCT